MSRTRTLLLRGALAAQRGQALVEYSTFTFAILLGSVATLTMVDFNGKGNLVTQLFDALQIYVNSYWYSLGLSLP